MISLRRKPVYEEPQKPSIAECIFYHSIDLPHKSIRGDWDLRNVFDIYTSKVLFNGKSVLDVGTATGFLSFEAEKRGASSVISLDAPINSEFDVIPWIENSTQETVDQVKKRLEGVQKSYWYCWNALKSKSNVLYKSVYDLTKDDGEFDIVMAGCILLHLINPIKAVIKMANVCSDSIVIIDIDPGDGVNDLVILPNYAASNIRSPGDTMSWWYLPPASVSRVLDVIGFDTVAVNKFSMFSPSANASGHFYSLLAKRR